MSSKKNKTTKEEKKEQVAAAITKADMIEMMVERKGSFFVFLGPTESGVLPTMPLNEEASKIRQKLAAGELKRVELLIPKFTSGRMQFVGKTYDEAITKAYVWYEQNVQDK